MYCRGAHPLTSTKHSPWPQITTLHDHDPQKIGRLSNNNQRDNYYRNLKRCFTIEFQTQTLKTIQAVGLLSASFALWILSCRERTWYLVLNIKLIIFINTRTMKIRIRNLWLGAILEETSLRNTGTHFTEFTFPPLPSIAKPKPPLLKS